MPSTSRSKAACLLAALCNPSFCLWNKGRRWLDGHVTIRWHRYLVPLSGTHCFPLKLSTPDTGPDSMGVESVQPPREPWTDVKTRCRRRQANARGRVGSFKVSPRAPRVLVSTSLSLSGGVGVPASAPTHAQQAHAMGWLALQLQNLSATGKLAVQRLARWELLLFRNTAPLCLSPTRARILSAEKHPFREMQDTCIDPQTTDEPRGGFVFGLPCFVDGSRSKAGHKGDSGHSTPWRAEEKRGHSNPPITARRLNMVSQTRVGRLAGQAETA